PSATTAGSAAPVALLCLGVAALATGAALPAVVALGCLPGAGGFLLQVLADSTGAPGWVRRLSPSSYLAPVPLQEPDGAAAAVMLLIAAVLVAAGAAAHRRRDLRS
ncbi:polyketide antibiotic transporter, partial [Kineococcus sp. T13]